MKAQISAAVVVIALFAGLILMMSSAFIVTEIDQAVVFQFGRPVRVIVGKVIFPEEETMRQDYQSDLDERNVNIRFSETGAGLYFKLPFIQQVEYFEDRILESDADPDLMTTRDQKRILVNSISRWHISNPLLYKQTLGTMSTAASRLAEIIRSTLRNKMGEYDFIEIVRSTNQLLDTRVEIPEQKRVPIQVGRTKILEEVTRLSREAAKEFGIYIIDVRIKRSDPPEQNMQAIYENMIAERKRIAERYRAEGNRQATFIRAETDRLVKTMRAEAERDAQIIRGQADAEAARIYAQGFIKEATGQPPERIEGFETDPEFYRFIRSLDTLEKTLDQNTSLILSTNSDLLRFLSSPNPND